MVDFASMLIIVSILVVTVLLVRAAPGWLLLLGLLYVLFRLIGG